AERRPPARAARSGAGALTVDEFDALVAEAREIAEEAIAQIWPQYGRELQNIEVVVADEPPPETLREMGMTPPDTLYGLYDGVPLNERGWDYGNALPDVISIFRGPIIRDCADDDEIVQEVSFTIVHEFAHYVGMTEEEIQEIEDRFWYGDDGADEDDTP
ncbi:MAG: metallopeptidase family protein, partial [Acidobacteria bacterium]|nr:metallopeptidase family protein [Acidobacteriota bacterium]